MEFFLVFLVSFIVLVAVALSFAFGKPPAYRPTRHEIFQLLVDVQNNNASIEAWEMFLSLPINHDPELEKVREACILVAFGDEVTPPAGEGLAGSIFDKEGMLRIRSIAVTLKSLLDSQPTSKTF